MIARHPVCSACGTSVDSGDRFCAACGTVLSDVQSTPVASDPASAVVLTADQAPDPFSALASILATLGERDQEVIKRRFGMDDGIPLTLEEVGGLLGITRERVRQIQARGMKALARSRADVVPTFDRIDALRQELGLDWEDDGLARAVDNLHPGLHLPSRPYVSLIAELFEDRGREDEPGIDGFEAAAAAVLSQHGKLPLGELVEGVMPLLDPQDLARFPSFSAEKRLTLVGPALRRNDGRYELPDGAIPGIRDKRVRRLNAMIGVLQELGLSHYTTIASALDNRLPTDYRLDVRNVHAWLQRYRDVFVWAGPGWYGLKSHDVGIRADSASDSGPLRESVRAARKGIGDEIAHLLVERGPLPLDAIQAHVLTRFVVQRSSVAAAIVQDSTERFVLGADGLVSLSIPTG